MHSGVCASPLEHAKSLRVCLSTARHLCYTNDPPPHTSPPGCVYVGFYPQVWLARGSCGARYSGLRGLNRPGIVSERGRRPPSPPFAWGERNGSPPPQHLRYIGAGGGGGGGGCWFVLEQPPCRRNQVLSVPLQTRPSISPVPLPLTRASAGRPGDASAPMTSSRDKRRTGRHKYCQRLADV